MHLDSRFLSDVLITSTTRSANTSAQADSLMELSVWQFLQKAPTYEHHWRLDLLELSIWKWLIALNFRASKDRFILSLSFPNLNFCV